MMSYCGTKKKKVLVLDFSDNDKNSYSETTLGFFSKHYRTRAVKTTTKASNDDVLNVFEHTHAILI